jgi:hypothetical protein
LQPESMRLFRTIRCIRTSLLALFVAAQTLGMLPLLRDHTLNIYETVPVATHHHKHVGIHDRALDADHHHGLLDLHDQCCALHTLAGPLPNIFEAIPTSFATARLSPDEWSTLTGADPAVLDRPPRPFMLS